jgi:cell division protein FtsB
MTPKRFFFVMTGSLVLLIGLIIASTVGGNMLLQKQSKKLVDLKAQNKVIEEQQTSLIQARKDIEKYKELNSIAKSIVPQDKDQAKTVREINKLAADSGIALKAITFQTSNLGQAPASAAPGATKPATPSISQVKPVDGIAGVYSQEITITPDDKSPVAYRKFLTFLEKLESNRRTAHVNKITVNPTDDGSALTFVLTLNAYVKP